MKKVVVALAVLLAGGFLWTSVRSNEIEPAVPLVASEAVLADPPSLPEASDAPSVREALAEIEVEERGAEEAAPALTEAVLSWCGQVVDGESGVPLAGASVERVLGDPFTEHTGQPTTWSGVDGRVSLDYTNESFCYARIELGGYATGCVRLDRGHEHPATAFPVRLLRAPTLELVVIDVSGAPRADLEVRATSVASEIRQGGHSVRPEQLEDPTIVGRTDERGRCELEGLPAEVAMSLAVSGAEGVLRSEERTLRLEAGERRTLRWTVGGLCRLDGQVLEANGRPAVGVALWLQPHDSMGRLQPHREDTALKAVSDAEGRFTLEVAAGSWMIGPAPSDWEDEEVEEADAIAPVGTPLEISPGQVSAEVTLTCWRGLYLKGRVLGADGELFRNAFVTAMGAETFASSTARTGELTLGPLPPGTYVVRASAPGVAGFAPSISVNAEAGDENLELVLQRAAGLSVRVLAPDGNVAIDAMVWALPEPGSEGGLGQRSSTTGKADFPGLAPGAYSLSASNAAGEFALLRGLRLEEGRTHEVELRLAPAARLRLEILPRPEPGMNVQILQDGCPIAYAIYSESPVVPLAPGEYELALKHVRDGRPVVLQTQRVRVLEGGETRAVFDLSEGR